MAEASSPLPSASPREKAILPGSLILDTARDSRILPPPKREFSMKQEIHPKYNPVIFQDMSTGKQLVTRSTAKSDRTETIDGVEHFVISIGVTADSHPFFTGQKQFVDTEGRIDKFQKRFGSVRRAKKPSRGE